MPTKAPSAIPEGLHTITPSLWFNGNCKKAVEFYEKAFNAQKMGPMALDQSGEIVYHAMLKIGNSALMLGDAWGEGPEIGPKGYTTMGLWLYVDNCDAIFEQAVKAGCKVMMPLDDQFWGDRMGKLMDPFGHVWAIATYKWVMSEEEMDKAKKAFEKSMSEHEHHGGCC